MYIFGRMAGVTVSYCQGHKAQCKKCFCLGLATTLMREIFAIESSTEERSEDRLKSHGKMLKSGKLRFGSGEKSIPFFARWVGS